MDKKPLLSICIPTYNRADYLDKTIQSIVLQKEFATFPDKVELVISDNASTDNTEEIVAKYLLKYTNVHYYKNKNNIRDKNFPLVLSRASGMLRKLCNDTLCYRTGVVQYLINIAEKYKDSRELLFFMNQNPLRPFYHRKTIYTSFEPFVKGLSFYSTWIGGMSVWEDDIDICNELSKTCDSQLWQTEVIYKILSTKNKGIIFRKPWFDQQIVRNKDMSYGIVHVFYDNFLHILEGYVIDNAISQKTYDYIEKDLLFHFFNFDIIILQDGKNSSNYGNDKVSVLKSIYQKYQNKEYFSDYLRYQKNYVKILRIKKIITKLLNQRKKLLIKKTYNFC
jgi:glycosyltransferase involved in cell wall biosynthesis